VHLGQRLVAHIARVVDQNIDRAKGIECGLDDITTAFFGSDRVVVGDRLATSRFDFCNDSVSCSMRTARTSNSAAKVINHNPCPTRGKELGVTTPDTITCASNHRDTTIETNFVHDFSFLLSESCPDSRRLSSEDLGSCSPKHSALSGQQK